MKAEDVKRAAKYAILLLTVLTIQNTFLTRLTVFGVKAMITPAAAAACGFMEGGVWGGFYGLVAGILCDMSFHESTVMFMTLFTAIGFFSGMSSHFFVNAKFFAYMFVSAAALLVTSGCQMLRAVVFHGASLDYAVGIAIKQALISIPFAAAMYKPYRTVSKRKGYR